MAKNSPDDRVTKRRVTMTNYSVEAPAEPDGKPVIHEHQAVDFVRPDHLDAYVADASTRWQSVTVSEEPDAGPGGYDGQTHVPAHLGVTDAGVTYPATEA